MFFFTLNAHALDTSTDDDGAEEELNAFGYPAKSFVTEIQAKEQKVTEGQAVSMPDCNDPRLLQQLRDNLTPYVDNGDTTIINRRKVDLVLKNINKMTPIDYADIDTSKTNAVADRVIELKINMKKHIEDIKICKSDSSIMKLSEFYVLMYYTNDDLTVEVINFANKNPTFTFAE